MRELIIILGLIFLSSIFSVAVYRFIQRKNLSRLSVMSAVAIVPAILAGMFCLRMQWLYGFIV